MGRVAAAVEVPGPATEAQALWLDPARWPNIIEDFRTVVRMDESWPASGEIVWDSTPHGRGRVINRMLNFQPGVEHTSQIEDEATLGEMRVTFDEVEGGRVRVRAELDYRLKSPTPFEVISDKLFIRRSVRDALRRNLVRFAAEREGDL